MYKRHMSKRGSVVSALAICAALLGVILAQAQSVGQQAAGNRSIAASASQSITPSDLTWGN